MGYTNEKLNFPLVSILIVLRFGPPAIYAWDWLIFSELVPLKFVTWTNSQHSLFCWWGVRQNETSGEDNFNSSLQSQILTVQNAFLPFLGGNDTYLKYIKKYQLMMWIFRYFLTCCEVSESCINILSVFESCSLVIERTLAWILLSLVKDTWRVFVTSCKGIFFNLPAICWLLIYIWVYHSYLHLARSCKTHLHFFFHPLWTWRLLVFCTASSGYA